MCNASLLTRRFTVWIAVHRSVVPPRVHESFVNRVASVSSFPVSCQLLTCIVYATTAVLLVLFQCCSCATLVFHPLKTCVLPAPFVSDLVRVPVELIVPFLFCSVCRSQPERTTPAVLRTTRACPAGDTMGKCSRRQLKLKRGSE